MAKLNTSLTLSAHFRDFAAKQVQSGRYGSTSEVVRAGLRLLEVEDERLMALRAEIQKGLNSGPARPFEWDAFMERKFGPAGDA